MLLHDVETKSRLLAKLLRELLAIDAHATLADLVDALKQRCSRLRIRYTPDDVASALQLVGSNHPLVEPERPPMASPPSSSRPLTRSESSRLYREITERYAAGRPIPVALIAPEVDADLVRRLSALGEHAALAFFWDRKAADANRLELLLLFEAVTIARPASWDARGLRTAFDAHARAWRPDYASGCSGCPQRDDLSLHHVITLDHGGSNTLRNLVPLCFACHRYLHPWLTTPDPRAKRRALGFESVGQIFQRVTKGD